jgi:chaperonin cofactor prefoldin
MLNQPFFQVTLPLMVTFVGALWAAQWSQNKRFDDLKDGMNKRLDEIIKRLDKIENRLEKLEERLTALEVVKWR